MCKKREIYAIQEKVSFYIPKGNGHGWHYPDIEIVQDIC